LQDICIDHQFPRRRYSEPPVTRSHSPTREFDHVVVAEKYASLIGRPKGTGKRTKQASSVERSQSQPPFRLEPKDLKGCLFSRSTCSVHRIQSGGERELETAVPQQTELIAALSEAAQSVPWESMLQNLEVPSIRKGQLETVTQSSGPAISEGKNMRSQQQRMGSPRRIQIETPQKSRSTRSLFERRNASDQSLNDSCMTASTSAGTDGFAAFGFDGSSPLSSPASQTRQLHTPGNSSPKSSPASQTRQLHTPGQRRQPRSSRASICTTAALLRAEQWKAKRRAAWVA
jgi:hypothetical protein